MARTKRGPVIQGEELVQSLEAAPDEMHLPSGLYQTQSVTTVLQSVDTAALSATFVIVTNEKNRHGNSHQITPTKLGKGMRTDRGFDDNPVVLFDHGLSGNPFPVARSSKVTRTARQATATATFPERLRDLYPNNLQSADDLLRGSAAVFAGVAEGLIRMSSIGFAPILGMLRSTEGEGEELPQGVEQMDCWRGIHFTETDLREWSIVTIGADRGALKQTLESGKIHDVRLPQFMRETFRQTVEVEEEPTVVPVTIDVSRLEDKVDRLSRTVRKLAKVQAAATKPEGGVATPPQTQTIPASQPAKVSGERLAQQYLEQTKPVDRSKLQSDVLKAFDEVVAPLAGSLEQVESTFRQSLGQVDN